MSWRNNKSLQTERERPVGIGVLKPGVRPATPGSDVFKDPQRVKAQEQEYDREVASWARQVVAPASVRERPLHTPARIGPIANPFNSFIEGWRPEVRAARGLPSAAEQADARYGRDVRNKTLGMNEQRKTFLTNMTTEQLSRELGNVHSKEADDILRIRADKGIDDTALETMPAFMLGANRLGTEPDLIEKRDDRQARLWREAAERNDRTAESLPARPGPGEVRELTDDEFYALTPRQRAAVLYNTELVDASTADKSLGGTERTKSFLSELDLLKDETDLDAFLGLDRAIGDSILAKLDDRKARTDAADAARWARGDERFAPNSTDFLNDYSAANVAAGRMADLLVTRGSASLRPSEDEAPGIGLTEAPRDQVLRSIWSTSISKEAGKFADTPEKIAQGIAEANATNGTDITPEELWDFASKQIAAVEFARVRGKKDVETPTWIPELETVDLSEIRKRYGL